MKGVVFLVVGGNAHLSNREDHVAIFLQTQQQFYRIQRVLFELFNSEYI